jgi:hypothetical protein
MEPGSCSRRSWPDEVEEAARSDANSQLFELPPLAAVEHAAFMLRSSSLDLDAEPFVGSPRGSEAKLRFTDPEASFGDSGAPPSSGCEPARRLPCRCRGSVVAGVAVLAVGGSWVMPVGHLLGTHHQHRSVLPPLWFTHPACRLSQTLRVSIRCRAGGVRGVLRCLGSRCFPTWSANASTALLVTTCAPNAHSPPGVSTVRRRAMRSATAPCLRLPVAGRGSGDAPLAQWAHAWAAGPSAASLVAFSRFSDGHDIHTVRLHQLRPVRATGVRPPIAGDRGRVCGRGRTYCRAYERGPPGGNGCWAARQHSGCDGWVRCYGCRRPTIGTLQWLPPLTPAASRGATGIAEDAGKDSSARVGRHPLDPSPAGGGGHSVAGAACPGHRHEAISDPSNGASSSSAPLWHC